MQLCEIEPFAVGFTAEKSDNISRKIAAGMYEICRSLPLSLDPALRLASVDPTPDSPIMQLSAAYRFGDGISVNAHGFERKAEAYPKYKRELLAFRDELLSYDTNLIFRMTITDEEDALMYAHTLWGGTWGGHSNPDYGRLLALGTDGLRELIASCRREHPEAGDWYDASLLVLDGIDLLAERFRALAIEMVEKDAANRRIYRRIADALAVVPKHPATDFMTACQSFYLVFTLDGRDSPGLFDHYMRPYYGKTDRAEAREILEGLWEGFHRTRAWNLCVGGCDADGNDMTYDLSYEILDVAAKYGYATPNLTARVHRNTSEAFWQKIADTLATGIGMPGLYNDEVVCPALEALGIPTCDAHLYAMNGCNQIDIQGKSHMGLEDGEVTLLKCLEYALTNGRCLLSGEKISIETGDPTSFRTFDEFFDAYKRQVAFATETAVGLANRSQSIFGANAPNPLRSMLIKGCLEKGVDFKRGGPLYNHGQILTEGLADTIDSLAAIRHFVYDTKTYTMAELVDALWHDFDGREEMRQTLLRHPEKFGNDVESVDTLGGEVLSHFFGELLRHRTWRGGDSGIYGGGLSTFERAARNGMSCGASADGRHARSGNIAESAGAVPGRDTHGPTALVNSVLHFDQKLAKSGFLLMVKFEKSLFATPRGKAGFIALAKTYFAGGGQMLSTTVVSDAELRDAAIHPENHRDLIVRVGGYSDYFVNLSPELRENVIARTTSGI